MTFLDRTLAWSRAQRVPLDDERFTDWIFYLPHSALCRAGLVGGGTGALIDVLASRGADIKVVEADPARFALLSERIREFSLDGVDLRHSTNYRRLPFESNSLTLLAARTSNWRPESGPLDSVLAEAARCLVPHGALAVIVPNRLFPGGGRYAQTPCGLKAAAERHGFLEIRMFSVLPSDATVPMFWIPLEHGASFRVATERVAALLDTVSADRQREASLIHRLAARASRITAGSRAAEWGRWLSPGLAMLAVKN